MLRPIVQYFKKELRSFVPAYKGLRLLAADHNFHFHFPVGILVFLAGWFFGISQEEWLWIIAAVFAVWIAEGFNTAIERIVDMVVPVYHIPAGEIKDISAGVVVMAVVFAGTVGSLVLVPYVWEWFAQIMGK
jgi:diacylglycerol kinase